MAQEQIRIEKIRVKELHDFACRILDRTKDNDIIPISKHRALAYSKNPYADDNDIGLLVAYMGNKCIGYLGIMPGLLRTGNKFSKVYWFSTWYVPLEFRKTSVGSLLMMNALSVKYDFLANAPGMSREAQRVYRALHFHELGPLDYYMITVERLNWFYVAFRLLQRILNKIGIDFEILDNLTRASVFIFTPIRRIIYDLLLHNQANQQIKNISYKEVSEIDDYLMQIKHRANSTGFYRDTDIINWMLKYKWILEPDKIETPKLNYRFAYVQDVFRYIALKVYSPDGKDYKGFMVLSVSSENLKTVLKVLDFCFLNRDDYKYIVSLALKYARTYKATNIVLPGSLATYIKDGVLMKFLLHKEYIFYFCHPKSRNSPLATSLNDIELQFCDGDIPFW
ncbi:MAG: hypothetical protein ACE5JB_07645 [bacterium]